MKAAILGTEDYHATMREIVDTSLHQMVSYVPQHMKPDSLSLLPVHPNYLEQVDLIMQKLAGDNELVHCNKRSPYLMLAWLCIGSDNEYRICQYVNYVSILKRVAIIHIRIALGSTPIGDEIRAALKVVNEMNEDKRSVGWSATWAAARAATSTGASWDAVATRVTSRAFSCALIAAETARAIVAVARDSDGAEDAARTAISTKARQWAHISDEEALQIARQLTLDILSL